MGRCESERDGGEHQGLQSEKDHFDAWEGGIELATFKTPFTPISTTMWQPFLAEVPSGDADKVRRNDMKEKT